MHAKPTPKETEDEFFGTIDVDSLGAYRVRGIALWADGKLKDRALQIFASTTVNNMILEFVTTTVMTSETTLDGLLADEKKNLAVLVAANASIPAPTQTKRR